MDSLTSMYEDPTVQAKVRTTGLPTKVICL